MPPSPAVSIPDLVEALAVQVRRCETARRPRSSSAISTGYAALDRALAGASMTTGGLARGTLVEWLSADGGCGATALALAAARQACGETGTLVVLDRRRTFYPLAAAARGIDLSRLLVVRPQSDRDETWAIDQALRSGGASAVLAWSEKLDDHLFRRLQLAAEAGDTLGLFVRPARAVAEPSWAEVRMLVEPLASLPAGDGRASRRVQITLLRSPGRAALQARRVMLDLEDPLQGEDIEPQRNHSTKREWRRKTA
jgi:hypothetical protein